MDYTRREKEHGNVLFLILIAVALFAALSYAVTQSTRGGGNADDETSLISSASLTQYPASLKTTILRMSITDGVDDDSLRFNPPSDAVDCTAGGTVDESRCVFFSGGGGASYQLAPSNVLTGGATGEWVFNSDNEIEDIGSNAGDGSGNEVIAFLVGVSQTVCDKINEELGVTSGTTPVETGAEYANGQVGTPAYTKDVTPGIIDGDGGSDELEGQPFGCFNDGGTFVYYHALSEN